MRKLIRRAAEWLMPSRGKHCAGTAPVPAQPAPAPRTLVVTTRPVLDIIDGDATAMVRPFLVAHEQERQRQAERRIALALATMGIDFPECAA
jgi:hypothetical protein